MLNTRNYFTDCSSDASSNIPGLAARQEKIALQCQHQMHQIIARKL